MGYWPILKPSLNGVSTDTRSSIDRASNDVSTGMSVDISVEAPHKIHDPYVELLIINFRKNQDAKYSYFQISVVFM